MPHVANGIDRQAKILIRELGWNTPGHRAAVDAALMAILVLALRSVAIPSTGTEEGQGRHAAIVARYRALVEERFRLREPIGAHARLLGVSLTTLRVACARIAGASPGDIFDMRVLLEAKRALSYSNLAIAEIAYGLGFNDAAYFTRMFTRSVGCSPRQFRQDRRSAAQAPTEQADR
jgi:AraC family transcriptional activator of pobA